MEHLKFDLFCKWYQYNLEFEVLKLLHLNMRKTTSYNYSASNNFVQP